MDSSMVNSNHSTRGNNWIHIHSKQLCVPLRIFLRVGNVSSFGISIRCVPTTQIVRT
jgi:hypothetical protein